MSNARVTSIITDILTVLNNSSYLSDPYVLAGGKSRTWAHKDRPLLQATYPRIQIKKYTKDNEIISLGNSKQRTLLVNIFFYTKKDFKVTINGTTYTNETLVEYYLDEIEDALDDRRDDISGTWGLKTSTSDEVPFLPDMNCYVGMLTLRIFYFKVEG